MPQKSRLIALFCLFFCLIFCFSPLAVFAQEQQTPSTAEAKAVLLYSLESQSLLVSKNESQVLNAGSTVKVMAGLIACEMLGESLTDTVLITREMVASSAGYRFYIQAGDALTVNQLLYAAICGSYNDAFDVLAHYISGSSEAFVSEMNLRAKALGADDTVFTTPSGIDDAARTSAKDLLTIALAAYQNELYMEISSAKRYEFSGSALLPPQTVQNRNALVSSGLTKKYYHENCRGMSAGYTELGGSCVVTAATNGSENYLCIIMGAAETDDETYGYVVANRLIDWVFDAYAYLEVIKPDKVICKIPVSVSDLTSELSLCTKESLFCFLPVSIDPEKDLTYSVRLISPTLEAPVLEGTMAGYLVVLYQGKKIGTLSLYTSESAERSGFIGSLKFIQNLTKNRAFVSGAIFFLSGLLAWIITEYVLYRRRHHKWDKYFSMKMNPAPNSLKSNPPKK